MGDNLAELSQELEKLALYAGEEKSLTPSLVNQLTTHSRTYNIFALVEALGEAGAHKRLIALGHLLDLGEHPAKILVMLAWQLRRLLSPQRRRRRRPGQEPQPVPVESEEIGAAGRPLFGGGPARPPVPAAPR